MCKVRLGDVAIEIRETCREKDSELPVVALEHLTPGEIRLMNWSIGGDNTFSKCFHKGQVLFGRRRAYLKKAALAPFDGICSGDITVIEAKPNRLLPELLPFIIQNDDFFDYAVGKSAGSLSPRVKWEHLKKYEFNLPSLEEQRKLADLLWSAYDLKESYKRLLAASDEMAKSRFVEMFGDNKMSPPKFPMKALGDLFKIGSSKRVLQSEQVGHGVPFLRISDLMLKIDNRLESPSLFISEEKYESLRQGGYVPSPGDILITSRGTLGCCYIVQPEDQFYFQDGMISWLSATDKSISNVYIVSLFQQPEFKEQINKMLAGTTVNYLSITMLKKIQVVVPPLALQNEYAAFIEQLDKSKAALQQSITTLDDMIKTLLHNNAFDEEEKNHV